MSKVAKIFNSDIHDSDYKKKYEEHFIEASSLIQLTASDYKNSLNGVWKFCEDAYQTSLRANWFTTSSFTDIEKQNSVIPQDWDYQYFDDIQVPSCWNFLNPKLFYYEGTGIYRRRFRYIREMEGERLFLYFEAVAYEAIVLLNGHVIGYHIGASTPFSVEITSFVQNDNELVVLADASRSASRIPGTNYDWFNYGGIYRDVLLVRRPQTFIKDWFISLVPDGSYSWISIKAVLDGTCEGMFFHFKIKELDIELSVPLTDSGISREIFAKPQLWNPADPKLYEVEIELLKEKKCFFAVHDRIGFREIKVTRNQIKLNGRDIYLKGVCVHEDCPEYGKAVPNDKICGMMSDIKALNGNFLRLSHYPHSRRAALAADEAGILLWEEIPVYWDIDFKNQETYADAENQLRELILRDRNRASVIIWSLGNENPDTDERYSFMERLIATARSLDSTRLVSAACLIDPVKLVMADRLAELLDIIGINEYYGWYDPDISKIKKLLDNSAPQKPVIISEFGASATAGYHGTKDDLFSEERQEWIYKEQIAVFKACQYIKGTVAWILYDFRSPRRMNHFQKEFNRKGLISENRKDCKKAAQVLADYYKGR